MQAFKAALRIVMNHPVYLLVYVGFLSLMGVFITSSINVGAGGTEYTASKAPFAVIDRDGSPLSESLTASSSSTDQNARNSSPPRRPAKPTPLEAAFKAFATAFRAQSPS